MKKDEVFNKKVADRLNKCISDQYKTNTDFIRELNKLHGFPVNNTRQGECFILESRLNQILKGKKDKKTGNRHYKKLDYRYALGFSKALRLPVEYLMGEIDYPSKEAEENAMRLEALSKWSKEDQEQFDTFKRVMSILSDRQFLFEFTLKEQYEATDSRGQKHIAPAIIRSLNMQHTLFDNGSYPIDDITMLSWLRNGDMLTITVHTENGKKYYHLDAYDIKDQTKKNKQKEKQLKKCITIIDKNSNQMIELDINSFMHMIYDIDESIKATIQNRCDCWMKYANFDHKEALDRSFLFLS